MLVDKSHSFLHSLSSLSIIMLSFFVFHFAESKLEGQKVGGDTLELEVGWVFQDERVQIRAEAYPKLQEICSELRRNDLALDLKLSSPLIDDSQEVFALTAPLSLSYATSLYRFFLDCPIHPDKINIENTFHSLQEGEESRISIRARKAGEACR